MEQSASRANGNVKNEARASYVVLGLVVVTAVLVLSWISHVPFFFMLIGFAAWANYGRLVIAGPRGDVKNEARESYVALVLMVITTALLLSRIWHVPYIFTLMGFAAWAFFGHLVTADDDAPGGWSNPDGTHLFPWGELVIKGGSSPSSVQWPRSSP